jgi:hypothetical protein
MLGLLWPAAEVGIARTTRLLVKCSHGMCHAWDGMCEGGCSAAERVGSVRSYQLAFFPLGVKFRGALPSTDNYGNSARTAVVASPYYQKALEQLKPKVHVA